MDGEYNKGVIPKSSHNFGPAHVQRNLKKKVLTHHHTRLGPSRLTFTGKNGARTVKNGRRTIILIGGIFNYGLCRLIIIKSLIQDLSSSIYFISNSIINNILNN